MPSGRVTTQFVNTVTGLLVLLFLFVGCGRGGVEIDADGYVQGDRPAAPEVAGELLEGGPYDLAAHKGEVVVINFWGSWCGPCRAEIKELAAVYEATKADKVSFVGIATRDEREKALGFIAAEKPPYPSLFDTDGALALRFEVGPNSVPSTLVIDRDGRIAAAFRVPVYQDDLEPVVRRIASEGR
jgi:thiol-disulfide isomerase/thioredoxin